MATRKKSVKKSAKKSPGKKAAPAKKAAVKKVVKKAVKKAPAKAKKKAAAKPAADASKYKPQNLLAPGTAAPDFSGKGHDGKTISLSDFKGKKLVLYFYPKDDTPTCTVESCNLRDNYAALLKKGYAVLGVSPDNEKSHGKFKTKHALPFPLLADPDKKVLNAYRVWGLKSMYGREYEGVHRTTYVIGPDGKIRHTIYPVDSSDHAAQVMALEN